MRKLALVLALAAGCHHASSRDGSDLGSSQAPSTDGGATDLNDASAPAGPDDLASTGSTDLEAPVDLASALDLASAPDLATPPDPNAPFPTPYCNTGTLVTGASQLTTLATEAPFPKYAISGATRDCTSTGCSAWSSWDPEFEGALGNGSPFVQMPQLTSAGSATVLELVNQYCTASMAYAGQWFGSTCTLGSAGQLSCGTYEWDMGHQMLGSGGTFCTPGELYLHETGTGYTMSGILTTSCFEVQTPPEGPTFGTQYAMDVHGTL